MGCQILARLILWTSVKYIKYIRRIVIRTKTETKVQYFSVLHFKTELPKLIKPWPDWPDWFTCVPLCVYIHVCMYVQLYVLRMFAYMYVCIYVCVCTCVCMCVYIRVCRCMFVYVCVYVCIGMCVLSCVHICYMCICT